MFGLRTLCRHGGVISRSLSASAVRAADALVVANGADSGSASAVTAALECVSSRGGAIDVLVAAGGNDADAAATLARSWDGVRKVYSLDAAPIAEGVASAVATRANDYAYLVSAASTFGKNVLPRVAGSLRVSAISDVIEIGEQGRDYGDFTRPIYAGNALARVRTREALRVITIRATNFEPAADGGKEAEVVTLEPAASDPRSRWVRADRTESARPDLACAGVVIAGGRGMKNAENFALLEELADTLGGAVGATRAAVDNGFCPNDMQIGQTGKIIAPELYIGVGISGAIQHLAGMKDSKVIVAINKDPDAPIFQVADYGVVGDLFEILPKIKEGVEKISAAKGG